MRHVLALIVCLAASSIALAQIPRADLFGGYSYLNIDTNDLSKRQSTNGWEASISGNFNKWFAVEASVAGYYKTIDIGGFGVSAHDYSYGAGPRLNFRPLFLHALIGGDHLTGSAFGFSASQDGLAGAFGGGVQWKVSGPWSLRGSADYVFSRHNILGGPSFTQNNVRASVGIVYSFGGLKQTGGAISAEVPAPAARTGMVVQALAVTVVAGDQGAVIVDEASNGVAAMAGLHPGDVINAVDGKPVKTPMDLMSEMSNRRAGDKVRIGFLIRGQWQSETTLILGGR